MRDRQRDRIGHGLETRWSHQNFSAVCERQLLELSSEVRGLNLSLSFDFGDVRLSHRRYVGLHKQYNDNMHSFLFSCIIRASRHFSCLPLKRPVANSAIGERVRVIS